MVALDQKKNELVEHNQNYNDKQSLWNFVMMVITFETLLLRL